MTTRQLNAWNWEMKVVVSCNDYRDELAAFSIQQYWDGTRAGHERLYKAAIEHLEGLADRLGLDYEAYRPKAITGYRWCIKTPRVVRIDRSPS